MDSAGGWLDAYHYAITRREIFRTLSPIPGASVTLRRLWTAERVRIRIITHRLFFEFFHAEAIKQTIEWLDRHAFPYWDICFMREKAAVGADLYIGDSPTNVEALRAAGKRVICYGNSTNEHILAPRAKDWREVETMVLQEFEDWEKGPQPTLPGSSIHALRALREGQSRILQDSILQRAVFSRRLEPSRSAATRSSVRVDREELPGS